MTNDCRAMRVLLAEGPLCKVEACDCGTVHVSLGPVTLRLRPEAVESIWHTIGDAIRVLYNRSQDQDPRHPAHERAQPSKAMVS